MRGTPEERFWKFVDVRGNDECWICKRSTVLGGYTQIRIGPGRRKVYCHRFSYEIKNGKIPDGMFIDHICGNPACVNPVHLRVCTSYDNARNTRVTSRNLCGVKGVQKRGDKWRARIRVDYKLINLGTYSTLEEASSAYRDAATKYFGEFAKW